MKGVTENEMVGWYHRINGDEFEPILELVKEEEPGRLRRVRQAASLYDNAITMEQNVLVK